MSNSPFKNKFSLRPASLLILFSFVFSFLPPTLHGQTEPPKTRELIADEKPFKDGKRLALVIGNAQYEHVTPLRNAANDARDMADTLRALGFEVLSGIDQTRAQMRALIRDFGDKLYRQNGGVGLFFYAGHGVQSNGRNYLVPVDADIPREDEMDDLAININFLIEKLDVAKNDLNILMLDACRNNPFAKEWSEFRAVNTEDGLGKIKAPKGTILIYATEPGNVASDGTGRNGLFTEALLEHIKQPDIELNDLYRRVGKLVAERSKQKQRPYLEGTNYNEFYFAKKPSAATTTALKTPPEPKPSSEPKNTNELKTTSESKNSVESKTLTEPKLPLEEPKTSNESKTSPEPKTVSAPETPGESKTTAENIVNNPPAGAPKEPETKPEEPETEPEDAAREAVKETVNSAPKVVEKSRFEREGEGWEAVKNSTDAQPIRAFLAEFPDGLNAEKAKIRLEKVVWDANRKTKDKAALEVQLKEFPNGANAPLAQLLLQQLEKREKAGSSEQTSATEDGGKDPQKAGLPATRSGTRKINPAADRKSARWVNIAGMEFVFIEPGKFTMGASAENIRQTDAVARKDYADFELSQLNNEKPARLVTISQGFLMGKFEVTQEQWKAVMGANPSSFKDCDKCPVERVSWEMAKDFVRRLNELDDGYVYRLPSEAEWEYAARAGTTGIFSGPIDQMAWHGGNSEDKTHPVGEKQWNPFGLYDIYGNVSEWCEDIYSPTYESLPADGSPNTTIGNEKRRVVRGGHWNSFPTKSRSNFRESHPARDYATHIGFRVVAVPKQ